MNAEDFAKACYELAVATTMTMDEAARALSDAHKNLYFQKTDLYVCDYCRTKYIGLPKSNCRNCGAPIKK